MVDSDTPRALDANEENEEHGVRVQEGHSRSIYLVEHLNLCLKERRGRDKRS